MPPSPACSEGSASQRKVLAKTRSQSLGLPPAPSVNMARVVGQLGGGVKSQWLRMPTTASRPGPTERTPISAGEGGASSLTTHGCSGGSLRTSDLPCMEGAPRTTTVQSGPKSSDMGGSSPVVLPQTSVSTPRTPSLAGAVTAVLKDSDDPITSRTTLSLSVSCSSSQRGRAPSFVSHSLVACQSAVVP